MSDKLGLMLVPHQCQIHEDYVAQDGMLQALMLDSDNLQTAPLTY